MKSLLYFLIIPLLFAGCNAPQMAGATASSHTFCLYNDPALSFTAITNAYIMLVDVTNGDMFHASTGAVTTAYGTDGTDGAAIPLTADAQNTEWACGTIPALDDSKKYALCVYENATPTLGDTLKDCYLYDPRTNSTFSDTNPLKNLKIRSINE